MKNLITLLALSGMFNWIGAQPNYFPGGTTATAVNPTVCAGYSSPIILSNSASGENYYLRDNSDNSIVDGPIVGTGSAISFNTGNLFSSTTFNIYASSNTDDNALDCSSFSSEYVALDPGLNSSLSGQSSISVEAKVLPLVAYSQQKMAIVGSHNTSNSDFQFRLYVSHDHYTFKVYDITGRSYILNSSTLIIPNAWQHVAATFDGSSMKIYVDGQLTGSKTLSGDKIASSSQPIAIGNNSKDEHFIGYIDNVSIWSDALSQNQINTQLNSCLSGAEPDLLANYLLNEASGDLSVLDSGPNSFDGSISTRNSVDGANSCDEALFGSTVTVNAQKCVDDTKVRADFCGNTLNAINDAIFCDAVAGATDYEWEITDPSNNVHTFIRQNGIEYVRLSYFGLGDLNTVYSVRVRAHVNGIWGTYSTVCTVTTPASLPAVQLSSLSCNITLSDINDFFYCDDVLGADYYEWEFTDPSNNVTNYIRLNGTPNMKLSYAGLIAPDVEYDVRVRGNFGGQWGPYGNSCTITSPADALITQVTANDCGRVLASFTEIIYCDKVPGATYYQWKFEDASNTVTTYIRLNGTTNFKLAYINLPALNTQYDVQVRAKVNGVWQSYGPICQITSPSSSAISLADNDPEVLELVKIGVFAEESTAGIEENNIFSNTIAYPNPFNDNLNVEFGNYEEKQITIYNSLGQVVMNLTTSDAKLVLETGDFTNGVYMMQVTSGNDSKVIRMIKH